MLPYRLKFELILAFFFKGCRHFHHFSSLHQPSNRYKPSAQEMVGFSPALSSTIINIGLFL
jgi:hypothetical protein